MNFRKNYFSTLICLLTFTFTFLLLLVLMNVKL